MIEQKDYEIFLDEIKSNISPERIFTDKLHCLALGTDAGFYRLIPRIIIVAGDEKEIVLLINAAARYHLPITFRAAGTSLSGQSITNSILVIAAKGWEKYSISPDHETITLQPGIVAQRVNDILAPYHKKFAPDPASVKSAMIGGIIMNNASGMNCGIHANSDRMIVSAKIVLADGTMLDTADAKSRQSFMDNHPHFIEKINELRQRIINNPLIKNKLEYKYGIKNVTGLNLLPFLLYSDPFDIITHLMVGSEGTLAFISEATIKTEDEYSCKASGMLYFTDIKEACRAVMTMKKMRNADNETIIKSAELLDWKSLASVNDIQFERYKSLNPEKESVKGFTAVLAETKARNEMDLLDYISEITNALNKFSTFIPVHFTANPEEYAQYWNIRAGIFPSVGGTRRAGTTCIIEDVAFHIENLPEATIDLQNLIAEHGYDDACIYGHALEGNYHFIINQSFQSDSEVKRYENLMNDIKQLVVDKYGGSLKAEHGTGRNMAPFVKYEWGEEIFDIMKEVKKLFDPINILNPGVIFNDDSKCHIKNFKPLPILKFPQDSPLNKINKCIECGFCEINCVSCGFTLSSRQRIVTMREIARLDKEDPSGKLSHEFKKQYRYPGEQTCAGDGLCAISCPMKINTGDLTHFIRHETLSHNKLKYLLGEKVATNFNASRKGVEGVLHFASFSQNIIGKGLMTTLTKQMHSMINLPLWTPALPNGYHYKKQSIRSITSSTHQKVVYFPSCINQTMGLSKDSPADMPLVDKTISLLSKAGYDVIFPENMGSLCCGTIWESKGMEDIADKKTKELEEALWEASSQGEYPVLCDQSPCMYRMRNKIKSLRLYEPAEFIYEFLVPRLNFNPIKEPVAIHITCSMKKMGLSDKIVSLARLCCENVIIPQEIGCCAFAGDKGFTNPELNAFALRKLKPQIEKEHIKKGFSNSTTCEIGLTTNSGIPYMSIVYLVDQCTTNKDNYECTNKNK